MKGTGHYHITKASFCNVVEAEVGAQGAKPLEIYDLLEKMLPINNYVELFARTRNVRSNWTSVGLELDQFFWIYRGRSMTFNR